MPVTPQPRLAPLYFPLLTSTILVLFICGSAFLFLYSLVCHIFQIAPIGGIVQYLSLEISVFFFEGTVS